MRLLILPLLLTLAACGSDGAAPGTAAPDTATTDALAPTDRSDRPVTRQDTVLIEGMPEAIELRLFEDPEIPFTAYYDPDAFTPEVIAVGEGAGVLFTFDTSAYAAVTFPAHLPATAEALRERLGGPGGILTAQRNANVRPADEDWLCPWATVKFRFDVPPDVVGHACGAVHAQRPFYVLVRYPAEYGDGFGPRWHTVLRTWQWTDGGALLPEAL